MCSVVREKVTALLMVRHWPHQTHSQFKRLEMGYNLFTQILTLPVPQGSFYYISLSSYSKLSKSLAQLFADKHMFTYKTEIYRYYSFKVCLTSCPLKLLSGQWSLLSYTFRFFFFFTGSDSAPWGIPQGAGYISVVGQLWF